MARLVKSDGPEGRRVQLKQEMYENPKGNAEHKLRTVKPGPGATSLHEPGNAPLTMPGPGASVPNRGVRTN
jgi:hypothetical protein